MMEQIYRFNHRDYNVDGTNLKDGRFFLDIKGDCEKDFHQRYSPFYSTHLIANASSMIRIKNSLDLGSKEDCGMDMIDGRIDLDKSIEVEKHSERTTIFGISSRVDEDEPLILVRDETMDDGTVLLKYIPDSDEEDIYPEVPVDSDFIKVG